jgi:hypothetical protein
MYGGRMLTIASTATRQQAARHAIILPALRDRRENAGLSHVPPTRRNQPRRRRVAPGEPGARNQ